MLSTTRVNLDRDDLAGFLPNLRAIRAFEDLAESVSSLIPTAVNDNTETIADLQNEVGAASSTATTALQEAALAMAAAQEANVQALTGQVASLNAELADARAQINDLKQGCIL